MGPLELGEEGRAKREGRKRKDTPGGKRRLKKNTTHPADGGRPVRLVLDLKPREYPPSFFFIFTLPPFASTRIPLAVASFSERTSLAALSPSPSFSFRFEGRCLLPSRWLQCIFREIYIYPRDIQAFV